MKYHYTTAISSKHSHVFSVFKNAWSYTPTPQYAFMTWCLVKHRVDFTVYLPEMTDEMHGL
jgi:hypothetical protein